MKDLRLRREALAYHAKPQPGKIEVVPTKKHATQRHLALAYSPGVAYPCLEIQKNPHDVYKYTSKGNLVAVISNGTAVLGLGDIGPEASKPVMEGKGVLFKIFAGIDVFDIEIDAKDVDTFVETVKKIAPTFGGINLEDIKAPEAFEIERRLVEELDIPVMHDDQHGTAIISGAALLNALELAGKKIDEIKMVIMGAGAAAISCARLYKKLGVRPENIVMLDSKGVIRRDRENLVPPKSEFATDRDIRTLDEAIEGADVFIGLSVANVLKPEHLKKMAPNPIVFALANPDPEIDYETAMKTRPDVIMATGRSDYPNQVNNVLGFPYIFRGALDVKAKKINDEMKLAAVYALAELAKEPVPEQVNIAYNVKHLSFGRDYIIPKPFDPRLIYKIPPRVAKAAMESGVAREPITDFKKYEEELIERLGLETKQIRLMVNRAKADPKTVVFPEADHPEVVKAAYQAYEEGIARPVLIGNRQIVDQIRRDLAYAEELPVIDPTSPEELQRVDRYAEAYWKMRQRKGMTLLEARRLMRTPNYFGAMMVKTGEADALVTGYSRSFPSSFKPLIQVGGTAPGVKKISSTVLLVTSKGPIFISDAAVMENPTAEELVEITRMTAQTVKMFNLQPVIAMVSFSNFGSSHSPDARKMSRAVQLIKEKYPDLTVDGEIQADFALNREKLKKAFPFSTLAGRKVNTLIMPNLSSANISYKLITELTGAQLVGPILMGMALPLHVVQLGASVDEIVHMTALAVIDAQERQKAKAGA
ncbi:MAG: NADP-dependent malic enzyme [Chlorobi bacterium]|nr:NADP-dependent malic enzyme [Chlorobiota bacterium]